MSLLAKVASPVPIVMILDDGDEMQYPLVRIYEVGTPVPYATLPLLHVALGRYEGVWTPSAPSTYSATFIVYSDAGHTVENIYYTREVEQIVVMLNDVDDLTALVTRTLGLVHENAFIDNTVFDANNELVAARVRVFDTKAHVEAATDGGSETAGLIAMYEMSTSYESRGKMGSYRMKRMA